MQFKWGYYILSHICRLMSNKNSILLSLLALLALAAYLTTNHIGHQQPQQTPLDQAAPLDQAHSLPSTDINDLDLTCGFTSDFAAFLAASTPLLIQTTPPTASKGMISSVLPSEARPAARRRSSRPQSSSSMATAIWGSEGDLRTGM